MANMDLNIAALAILAVHLGALILAARSRDATPLLLTNIGASALALYVLLTRPATFRLPIDWQILSSAAFELVAGGIAIVGLRAQPSARRPSIVSFMLHLLRGSHAIGRLARQMETSDAARPFYRGSDHWRAA